MMLSVVMLSLTLQAQVKDCSLTARYIDFYEWDSVTEEYDNTGSDFMRTTMKIREDYYVITIADDDPATVYWEYRGKTDKGSWRYITEDGRKVLLTAEDDTEIVFFYKYDEADDRYTKGIVLSKITID